MSRANHRGLFLLDQVYFVIDCVAWVLSGSRCPPHLLKEEEGGLISARPPPIIAFLAGCPQRQGSLGPGGYSPESSRICYMESTMQGRLGHGLPHVGLEGSLLTRGTVLEVVGHPASQCQGPECSLQVPLP